MTALFAGPGEVRAQGRAIHWAATPLGLVDAWAPVLRDAVRTVLDSPVPMCLWCGPAYVLVYNDAYRRVLGAKHPAALGSPGAHIWAEAWSEIAPQLAQVRGGGPPVSAENAWFTAAFSAVRDADGAVHAVLGVATGHPDRDSGVHASDVTSQVLARRDAEAARDEAQRARAEAEAAGRLKSEFLATMSHEFRTPLNAILGYAQLLDMGILGATTPAQHAHLERLQASARHLLQLVDDVLDIAKVDADRLAVRREMLATGAAVAAALALVQPQATAKGVRIEDHGVTGPGVPYVGDEHRVRQILVNLLSNAVKFTPAGGQITITCGAAPEPDPGVEPGGAGSGAAWGSSAERAWTCIRVEDTGPGIPPELEGRLFQPFVQGDGAFTRAHGGTGLGLAISRRLARLMGGDLALQRRSGAATLGPGTPQAGASFALWLPAPSETADRDRATVGRRTPAGMAAVAGRTAPAAAEATGAALTAEAYAVLHALGMRLAADAESVAERYVAALRADARFPGARDLPAAQLRDHATSVVGLLASQLMVIGEMRGRAPELLADGAQVQRVMAELHGTQRHRLGWAEADIERETPLLRMEVARSLDGALLGADHAGAGAAQYAADVTQHVLDEATQTALRAYRFARAAATP